MSTSGHEASGDKQITSLISACEEEDEYDEDEDDEDEDEEEEEEEEEEESEMIDAWLILTLCSSKRSAGDSLCACTTHLSVVKKKVIV